MWWKILRSFVGNIHPLSSSERILFENRLRFEKVIGKSLVASFFGTRCMVYGVTDDLIVLYRPRPSVEE